VLQARAQARALGLAPVVADLRVAGVTSLSSLARAFTERNIPTARCKDHWTPAQVSRVLAQLEPKRLTTPPGAVDVTEQHLGRTISIIGARASNGCV
jgi:hypothetical protein